MARSSHSSCCNLPAAIDSPQHSQQTYATGNTLAKLAWKRVAKVLIFAPHATLGSAHSTRLRVVGYG
jgi:hypothetical protein